MAGKRHQVPIPITTGSPVEKRHPQGAHTRDRTFRNHFAAVRTAAETNLPAFPREHKNLINRSRVRGFRAAGIHQDMALDAHNHVPPPSGLIEPCGIDLKPTPVFYKEVHSACTERQPTESPGKLASQQRVGKFGHRGSHGAMLRERLPACVRQGSSAVVGDCNMELPQQCGGAALSAGRSRAEGLVEGWQILRRLVSTAEALA